MQFAAHVLTLVRKECLVLARDRQAALLLFAMPAVFVLFLSLALQQVYGEKLGLRLDLVLEVEDEGLFATRVEKTLRTASEFRCLARPEKATNATLFQENVASAVVRIPRGFSADAEAFLERQGKGDFGAHKLEWEASPALDVSYRWLIEARLALTCLQALQAALEERQAALGEKLTAMGAKMERMGGELEQLGNELETTGAELERTGARLAETGALLEATAKELTHTVALLENARALFHLRGKDLERAALAAAAEDAANAEADTVRRLLAQRGALPADVALEEPPPPQLSFDPNLRPAAPPSRAERRTREAAAERDPELTHESARAPIALEDVPALAPSAELFLARPPGTERVLPTPLQQTVPGWSLFAMFFIVVPLSQGLHRERADGTLLRMLALGVSERALVCGRLLPYLLVGLLQFAGMLTVGLYVLPLVSDLSLDLGEHPLTLVPITLVCALAATSFGLCVATLARTPEQAAAAGATAVILLAVIGGVMVPHFVMPAFLQKLALASPLYWGHRAYLDFFVHHASLREIAPSLGALLGFALVCLALAARRLVPRGT